MEQALSSQNEFINFKYLTTIFYVEDTYDIEINSSIQSNLKIIVSKFNAKGINFFYLPYLLQSDAYQKVIDYNRPYIKSLVKQFSVVDIYKKIINKLDTPLNGGALVRFSMIDNKQKIFVYPIIKNESLIEQLEFYIKNVYDKQFVKIEIKESNSNVSYQRRSNFDEESFFLVNDIEIKESNQRISFCKMLFVDEDLLLLATEIRDRIKLLKEYGSLKLIGEIIEDLQNVTFKLSRLTITKDCRIFLKDYDMKEVVMTPLAKCLFILYLRHPEGIIFKHLSDYNTELFSIYKNISLRENMIKAIFSIRGMSNPHNNSVNEKCSRIRAAFKEVISDDLAKNYYITGKKGELKNISIDRSLIEYQ